MREELNAIKTRIIDGKTEYRQLAQKKKDLMNLINTYINRIKGEIADEMDDKGKPVFSNQVKRDAEFTERTENDKKYNQMVEKLESIQGVMNECEVRIEEAVYDFRIEEILSRLG